jgi:hypothetical protein
MSHPIEYTSFLIRLWRLIDMDSAAQPGDWQVEVKHIQSGQCWSLHSVAELQYFFRQQTEHPRGYACIDMEGET